MYYFRSNFYVCFIDETSISYWSNIRKKTWTDSHSVTFPYQASRGVSHTIYGCIAGFMSHNVRHSHFKLIYHIAQSTNKFDTRTFLEKIIDEAPVPVTQLQVILDGHSAHRSYYVTKWASEIHLNLITTPPYSSVLNPSKFQLYGLRPCRRRTRPVREQTLW